MSLITDNYGPGPLEDKERCLTGSRTPALSDCIQLPGQAEGKLLSQGFGRSGEGIPCGVFWTNDMPHSRHNTRNRCKGVWLRFVVGKGVFYEEAC